MFFSPDCNGNTRDLESNFFLAEKSDRRKLLLWVRKKLYKREIEMKSGIKLPKKKPPI